MDWTAFVQGLLDWYVTSARDLPWRKNHDAYRVWVSEIMLQQTRVDTVIPFYNRFMETFPTVEALAGAEESVLLKHWEGLGYYTRARNLQKAARMIADDFGGVFPREYDGVRRLPGVGDYTAGAICSIAYGLPTPAVDGNVLRVLSRVLADDTDIMKPETKKRYTALLAAVYPEGRCGDFTQSLMELGALVCVPGAPACDVCPVAAYCKAYQTDTVSEYPVRNVKISKRVEDLTVFLISDGAHMAIRKRDQGLLGGMWAFPHVPGHLDAEAARDALLEMGYLCYGLEKGSMVKHIFTHVTWRMQVYHCSVDQVEEPFLTESVTLPTAFRKLL